MPKRKATAAQLRNLAKGRRKLAAMRRAGTVTRKKRATRAVRPRARKRNPELSYEAGDLILFADNTEPLYKDKQRAIRRVIKSLNRGTYTKSIGVHIWRPFVEKAAGRYRLELQSTIPRTAKTEAANEYEKDALAEIMTGDWEWVEELIPRSKYTKGNPAHGNFMNARNVLRTGRTTNPKKRRSIPGGPRVPATYIIASIDPRPPNRIIYWGAFGWGPAGKALMFPNATDARKIAEKKMKRPAAVVKPKTAERLIREALTK